MANLLASQVQLQGGASNLAGDEFFSGGVKGRAIITRRLKITGGVAGGQTNQITASVLGFKKLLGCSNIWDAQNNRVVRATIDPVNNIVLLGLIAGDGAVDVTHVASYITVWGT
jgi:hypothetical protein